jgi:hypothetical protein
MAVNRVVRGWIFLPRDSVVTVFWHQFGAVLECFINNNLIVHAPVGQAGAQCARRV